MKIRMLAFGIAREICGARVFDLELPDDADTDALFRLLQQRFPELQHLRSCLLAVNESYVQENMPLSDGDEVAIIPPVSGG